jgi:hypothetical protein
MSSFLGVIQEERARRSNIPEVAFCEVKKRLTDSFLSAIHEMSGLQNQQMRAVVEGDADFARFDLLLHLAQEKKDAAKYAWIAHVETHGCEEG